MIDTHAHLYAEEFDADRTSVIDNALQIGVSKILLPNVDLYSVPKMLATEALLPEVCRSMIGLHPCYVDSSYQNQLIEIEKYISQHQFVAIGEVGLDFFHDLSFVAEQKKAFEIQINWALHYQLPLVIHCRNSTAETLAILAQFQSPFNGVFHCFSGSVEQANEAINMGFKLGIGGVVTFKNSGLDKVLSNVGIENIVLETDCPYLAPVPHRGKRNEPSYIHLVATKIAEVLSLDIDNVIYQTQKNSENIFRL